jgi:hypothetical protein
VEATLPMATADAVCPLDRNAARDASTATASKTWRPSPQRQVLAVGAGRHDQVPSVPPRGRFIGPTTDDDEISGFWLAASTDRPERYTRMAAGPMDES